MLWTMRGFLSSAAAKVSSEFGSRLHTVLYALKLPV